MSPNAEVTEKLAKNLRMSESRMVKEMQRMSEAERRKSIIGKIREGDIFSKEK